MYLYKGCEESSLITRRPLLLTYLRGTKAQKEELKKTHSNLYRYFTTISTILRDHSISSHLPLKYALILRCCFKPTCVHPICHSTSSANTTTNIKNAKTNKTFQTAILWSDNGPSIANTLPIPVKDKSNPGHYLQRLTNIHNDKLAPVPSVFLSKEYERNKKFSRSRIQRLAAECLLDEDTVKFYVNHLERCEANRKKGVEKAKKTRELKKNL